MGDQPHSCQRNCPMETVEFIERMTKIEQGLYAAIRRLDDDQKARHEQNTAISSVVSAETLARMNLEESVKELTILHRELLGVIRGTEWNEGLFQRNNHLAAEVSNIRGQLLSEEQTRKAYMRSIVVLGTALGAIGGIITSFLTIWLKLRGAGQ